MHPVLLLEDEPFIALDLEGLLNEHGFDDVVALTTRHDALKWLAANKPRFAIVDPRLADGLCADVVRDLAARKIAFIVYSGDPGPLVQDEPAFARGKHLFKPSSPEVFMAAIERLAVPMI